MKFCVECGDFLSQKVIDYSQTNFGISLCIPHQKRTEYLETITTPETLRLYWALRTRNVPAQIEKFDGFKHIDIAIPEAKINIEVDGMHHNNNPKQALSDLKRTYHSFLKGYFTLRIPNSLIYNEDILNETADYIVYILNVSNNKIYGNRKK